MMEAHPRNTEECGLRHMYGVELTELSSQGLGHMEDRGVTGWMLVPFFLEKVWREKLFVFDMFVSLRKHLLF